MLYSLYRLGKLGSYSHPATVVSRQDALLEPEACRPVLNPSNNPESSSTLTLVVTVVDLPLCRFTLLTLNPTFNSESQGVLMRIRSRMDIMAALLLSLAEYAIAYIKDILTEVRKGPQITATVESKEEISGTTNK